MGKISRTDSDLIQSLNDELEKLKDFHFKVYNENNKKYLGNIAAQLRILVIKKGNNQPLLLELMEKYSINHLLQTNPPPGSNRQSKQMTILEFLERRQIKALRLKSGQLISLTNKELILKLSQQFGGAHQDFKADEDIMTLRDVKIPFLDIDLLAMPLKNISKIILNVGSDALPKIKDKLNKNISD